MSDEEILLRAAKILSEKGFLAVSNTVAEILDAIRVQEAINSAKKEVQP